MYAAEGTEAHALCEYLLKQWLKEPCVDPRPSMQYYSEEMEEAAQGYVQYIMEKVEGYKAGNAASGKEAGAAEPSVYVEQRLDTIERLVSVVEEHAPETVEAYRARLWQKLQTALEGREVDEARVVTECAVFADRIAVDEETVRLRSHIAQMRQMLAGGSPFGRKADFLIQEFNRESNTIGSKCQNAEIAKVVVDLKSEIEKIREQIQNIE